MPMFRFWSSESRGIEQTTDIPKHQPESTGKHDARSRLPLATGGVPSSKRSWDAFGDSNDNVAAATAVTKRPKLHHLDDEYSLAPKPDDRLDAARDIIRHQVGLEVLLKHDELRLINQELAKCQVALEQLRRCHLIPYPQYCPTPEQMMDISNGKGPAAIKRIGEPVPQWAAPFGVTDGPYARHYAKWLIPDPSFDGEQPEWQFTPEYSRSRNSIAEGRTTRNSFTDIAAASKGRPVRGNAGQKLQALSNNYAQPKDKAGPCILKRSDGQTVKLVCLDCNRENFSSTQGFINHCRIAHKRDFKSHEEAAVQSGQPLDSNDSNSSQTTSVEDKAQPSNSSSSVLVHPFARQDVTEQEAYAALRSRIADSLKLYHQGKLPGVAAIPKSSAATSARIGKKSKKPKFNPAPETPFLSHLMKSRNFKGNLHDLVADAKTRVSLEDLTPDEDSDDTGSPFPTFDGSNDAAPARTPVVKRMPAQSGKTPALVDSSTRPVSSKGRATVPLSLVSPPGSTADDLSKRGSDAILSDEDVDMDEANLSPNTLVSNNAPSLVSDDGEYDDSDDGSSMSGVSDELDDESVSDVAEITLDDDHDPRPLRRGSNGVPGTVRLRKDDDKKHVTFLGPVKNRSKERKTRRT